MTEADPYNGYYCSDCRKCKYGLVIEEDDGKYQRAVCAANDVIVVVNNKKDPCIDYAASDSDIDVNLKATHIKKIPDASDANCQRYGVNTIVNVCCSCCGESQNKAIMTEFKYVKNGDIEMNIICGQHVVDVEDGWL